MLSKAVLRVEEQEVHVLLPPGQGFTLRQLQKAGNRKEIEAAAERAMGRPMKVRLVEGIAGQAEAAPAATPAEEKKEGSTHPTGLDDPRVKKLVKLFNGKVVEAQEATEEET